MKVQMRKHRRFETWKGFPSALDTERHNEKEIILTPKEAAALRYTLKHHANVYQALKESEENERIYQRD